jgi:hypothetical protein
VPQGELLDRARIRSHTAAGRPIRLRQHQRDVVPGLEEPRQRALGEWRGAGED